MRSASSIRIRMVVVALTLVIASSLALASPTMAFAQPEQDDAGTTVIDVDASSSTTAPPNMEEKPSPPTTNPVILTTMTTPAANTDSIPTSVWILGGTSVVGIVSFTFFGLTASSDLRDLRSTCAPDCARSSRDDVHTKALIADVSLSVAVVAAAVAVVLYVVHR